MKSVVFIWISVFGLSALAENNQNRSVQKMAHEYLVQKQLDAFFKARSVRMTQNCDNAGGSGSSVTCIDIICEKLGTFGCDSQTEIQQVAQMCKGQVDGDCVHKTCDQLGTFGCDSPSEVEQVAKMCKGKTNGKCLDLACENLGTFGCDTMSEVHSIHQTVCKPAVDPDCMKSVCQKLGTFGCDTLSELQQVSNSCAGL